VYQKQPSNGGTILVLGILGFVCCGLCGIAAWTMGNTSLKEMSEGFRDEKDRGMVEAGRILGMISTCLMVFGVCIWMMMLASGVGLGGLNQSRYPGSRPNSYPPGFPRSYTR